jgi:hypothetical protein
MRTLLSSRTILILVTFIALGLAAQSFPGPREEVTNQSVPMFQDWSMRHVVYPNSGPMTAMRAIQQDPRAWFSWRRRLPLSNRSGEIPHLGADGTSGTLLCANLPASMSWSCSSTPGSLTAGANSANSTLTIATTAASATLRKQPRLESWLSLPGVVFAVVGIVGKRARFRGLDQFHLWYKGVLWCFL